MSDNNVDRIVDMIEPDEFEGFPSTLWNVFEVLLVATRKHDPSDAGTMSGQDFLLNAADWKDQPAKRDFAGNGGIVANGLVLEEGDQCGKHRNAR
jgi:hypothetical protein